MKTTYYTKTIEDFKKENASKIIGSNLHLVSLNESSKGQPTKVIYLNNYLVRA